jgi:hypothetical protein
MYFHGMDEMIRSVNINTGKFESFLGYSLSGEKRNEKKSK